MIRSVVSRTALIAAAIFAATPALADVVIPVSQETDGQTLVVQVTQAAQSMCVDAEAAGEVSDVDACVTAVVRAVAEESGNAILLAHVNGTQLPEQAAQPVRQAALSN
jgi:hypothetical protein